MVEGGGEDDEEEADGEDLPRILSMRLLWWRGGGGWEREIRTKERTMMVLRPAIAGGGKAAVRGVGVAVGWA